MTNGVGSLSPGPRPPEASEGEKEIISEFKQPLNLLVQNCTMLHNIVGPACIFLRQGLSQAQLVCMQKSLVFYLNKETILLPCASSCGDIIMKTPVMLSTIIFIQSTLNVNTALHVYVCGIRNALSHEPISFDKDDLL